MRSRDYLRLPDCVYNEVPVELSDKELETYSTLRKELVVSLGDSEIDASNAASLANKLSQMANGAVYADGDKFVCIDLQQEINADIDALVDLKRDIMNVIKAVQNQEAQTILEKRYLCFLTWETIATEMGYDLRYIHKMHNRALQNCNCFKTSG